MRVQKRKLGEWTYEGGRKRGNSLVVTDGSRTRYTSELFLTAQSGSYDQSRVAPQDFPVPEHQGHFCFLEAFMQILKEIIISPLRKQWNTALLIRLLLTDKIYPQEALLCPEMTKEEISHL